MGFKITKSKTTKMKPGMFDQFDAAEYTTACRPNPPVQPTAESGEAVPSSARIIGVNANGTPKTARYPGAFTSTKPTPFELAGGEKMQEEFANEPDQLYNDRPPRYIIKHQKPEHRNMILLKAQGCSNKEIAELMGVTAVCVANVLKQPWARQQVLQEINSLGRNEVTQIFKSAAADVAQMLVDTVNSVDEKVTPREKISAGSLILDRLFGKAAQPIDVSINDGALKKMSDEELLRIATNGSN